MKTKICSECNLEKPIKDFSKHCSEPDGLRRKCRICSNKATAKRKKTKWGLITSIYSSQRRNSKDRPYGYPKYTNQELHEWALKQEVFHELYDAWVASGHKKNKVPSFDRLNDYKGYSLDNLRIVTWEDNKNRWHEDCQNGKNNKQNKAIMQFDRDGNFIREYFSVHNAARNISEKHVTARKNISMAACGNIPTAYGFIWKFK